MSGDRRGYVPPLLKTKTMVMRLVGQQAGQPKSQYAGHQEGHQATGKSVGRPSDEKKIHHCPVMQGLCKLQSEEFLLRPA